MSKDTVELPSPAMPSEFDRLLANLHDLPDVVKTRPSIERIIPPFGVGGTQLFSIQTIRQGKDVHVFFEFVADGKTLRIAIPPKVGDLMARQRDAVSTMLRRKLSKASAEARREAGIEPGFMKARTGKKR